MDEDEEFREPAEPIFDLEPDAPDPTKGLGRGARSGCLLGLTIGLVVLAIALCLLQVVWDFFGGLWTAP